MPLIHCRYCENEHDDQFLCGPAKRVLDALLERGQRFDMPTVEFPEAITGADALGPGTVLIRQLVAKAAIVPIAEVTVLIRQLVAKAAIVPIAEVPRPTLVLTGQDIAGNVLPQWVYPADATDLGRVVRLVGDMVEMAVRRAREMT